MNFRFIPLSLTLLALMFLLGAGRTGADPASAFLAARQSVPGGLLTGTAAMDAARHPGGYAGRTLDLAVTVSGLVTVGADRTALLALGSDSVSVPVPARLHGGTWLDAGVRVRVLLVAAPDDGGLPSGLRLVAVAPEGDVVAVEKGEAAHQAALARTLPYITSAGPSRRMTGTPDYSGHPAGALSPRALAIYAPYRGLVRHWNRRLSEADVDKITTSILYFSDINNIDPRLVVATIIAESDFDVRSTSRAGAMGLAQIMPDEARGLGVTMPMIPSRTSVRRCICCAGIWTNTAALRRTRASSPSTRSR